jgi:NAD(P)-dependent dehydrogenase (short-subunit alcohol dehydrogenase family)
MPHSPGEIMTEIMRGQPAEEVEKSRALSILLHPLGRIGKPEEVAPSIAFLASENASSFTTGSTLYIDGGRTAKN